MAVVNCPFDSGSSGPRTCRWTAATLSVPNTGVAGTINIQARLNRYTWTEGQPIPMSVAASGTFTPSGGSQSTFATERVAYLDAIADGFQNAGWQSGLGFVGGDTVLVFGYGGTTVPVEG